MDVIFVCVSVCMYGIRWSRQEAGGKGSVDWR